MMICPNLKLWLEGNKLSLNVTKTQAMLIGSRAKLQNISNSDVISPKFVIDDPGGGGYLDTKRRGCARLR